MDPKYASPNLNDLEQLYALLISVFYACEDAFVCAYIFAHVPLETQGRCWVFSSVVLHHSFGSLTEPGAHPFARLAGQQAQGSSVSASPVLGLQIYPALFKFLCRC